MSVFIYSSTIIYEFTRSTCGFQYILRLEVGNTIEFFEYDVSDILRSKKYSAGRSFLFTQLFLKLYRFVFE
ncbi:hypothetical protein AR158_c214R [Paramecium bursaria Chlorella virus AR158]|uniref:hypothetical protein n=1 Tax=Paramecium bursaria Chlorella virus AR158 TaxID=380598 RepID=UPI00015AA874|nr:hypothetical protein AR158_c214R [Paramecium bursaria Chlorella virus AR158]ABU43760.1 hypothetical protein AR158_c214R [Paramecium bursaria Chlorella virus AR158]